MCEGREPKTQCHIDTTFPQQNQHKELLMRTSRISRKRKRVSVRVLVRERECMCESACMKERAGERRLNISKMSMVQM